VRLEELEAEWPQASARVTSLDQLYSLAMGVALLLERRCREWAGRSRGRVDDADLGEGEAQGPPASLDEDLPAMDRLVRSRLIKRPERAMEKALMRYGGDVSKVLDVVRCRILFEHVADLHDCLRVIRSQSPAVKILRIMNSMHLQHEALLTGGFRVRLPQRGAPPTCLSNTHLGWRD
jgi:hypothetical protein